jgi:rhomboid protease GluP
MARPSSTLCPSCGQLVGVKDDRCLNCGRRNPGMWGFAHLLRGFQDDSAFAQLVLWFCGALYLASLVADIQGIQMRGLFSLFAPSVESLFMFGASGAIPVFRFGRWWTLLSAGWLHGSVLHILFNMYWVRALAPGTAHLYGTGRTVIIYTVAGVSGFLASTVIAGFFPFMPGFLRGAGFTVGASASILGLLGALLYYGRRGSSQVGQQAKSLIVILLIFGFVMPGVDNWAHLGGLGGGYLMAKWLDPLKPERGDHLLMALGCLVASLLAILVSIVDGLKILR